MEKSSYLGTKIARVGNVLKTATSRINDCQKRLAKAKTCYQSLFKDLIIDKFDKERAFDTARKLFNKSHVNFVAIDGTEYSRPLFDMIIFYAGAYSSEGSIEFSSDKINVTYNIGHCILKMTYQVALHGQDSWNGPNFRWRHPRGHRDSQRNHRRTDC